MKRAIITGVYGQDGSYLSELMHNEGIEVYGICREKLSENSKRIKDELIEEGISIKEFHIDLNNYEEVKELVNYVKPDMVYHMAALHRSSSDNDNNSGFKEYELFEKNISATGNILTACWDCSKETRVLTAGSCLMFDESETSFQNENTAFKSKSMYGIAKITENQLVKYYRKKGLFCCMAILYNHESHRRSNSFITKSIAKRLKNISKGSSDILEIGDLSAKKDWGFAGDYINSMYLMLSADFPKDYIVSSGEMHSIKEYIDICMEYLKMTKSQVKIVENKSLITRRINTTLCGDSSRCESELGWRRKTSFEEMILDILKGV